MDIARTLNAFLLRDWRAARSYRLAWVLGLWGSFFQLFLYFFLSRIVHAPALEVAAGRSVDYFAFVVVGLALYGFVTTGIGIFADSLRVEQTTGTLEVLFSLPTPPSLTIFGTAAYGYIWSLISTTVLLLVSMVFFGFRPVLDPTSLLASVLALVASLVLFASLGIVIGAFTLVFKKSGSFVSMVTQMLSLLSGVFFPIALLPRPLQWLSEAIPLTWALDVLRQTLLAGEVPVQRIAFLVGASFIAVPISLWIFRLSVLRARQDGSLALY